MPRRLLSLVVLTLALVPVGVVAAQSSSQAGSDARLRISIPADDGSLTPYTFESGYAFMSLIYDTLTWRDAAGNPQPWLARSIGRSVDGRTVSVRLRQDVRWHDGRPLTANDVVFTYRFMADRAHPRFTPQLQDIERVSAPRRLIVEFRLRRRSLGIEDQPFADVPILPRHIWEGLPRTRRAPPGLPVGSGPYRLTAHDPGRSYRFEAYRDYFKGEPSVSRIDVPVIDREGNVVNELRRRRVDAGPVTVAPGSTFRPITGVRLSDELSFSGTMLLFNVRRPPFNRLAPRQAVAVALDLDAIAGNAAGVDGGVVPADRGMLHPRSGWARAGDLHRFDRGLAELAFAEQGIGPFTVAVPRNDSVRRATGERVVRALQRAGAEVRTVELGPNAMDQALGRAGTPAIFDAAVVGIPALASFDPAFLRVMFGDPQTASLNDGGYRSSAFDQLAERAAAARTENARREAIESQLRLLARDLPAVPLLFGGGTIAFRPAAYDRWVGVRGTGILDKRSFLRGALAATATGGSESSPTLTDTSDDQGFSLVPIIIGFVVIMLLAAAYWLRRARA